MRALEPRVQLHNFQMKTDEFRLVLAEAMPGGNSYYIQQRYQPLECMGYWKNKNIIPVSLEDAKLCIEEIRESEKVK